MTSLSMKLRRIHFWEVLSLALFVALIINIYYGFDFGLGAIGVFDSVSEEEIGEKVVDFININIFQGQAEGKLVEVTEEYGLYSIKMDLNGQELNPYATKDGKIMFPQGIDLDEGNDVPDSGTPPTQNPTQTNIPKNSKPVIDLFVMSQCPYGTIAEQTIAPVLDLLGDKVEFNLYFIAKGAEGVFTSLHGQPEIDEDIRQVCIAEKYSRDVLIDYLLCVADDYKIVGTIWEDCAEKNGIDVDNVKECAESDEGKSLFVKNIKPGNDIGVSGSPTLIINGAKYGGARTPEGYKSAVCSGFSEEPSECETGLNEGAATATGSC